MSNAEKPQREPTAPAAAVRRRGEEKRLGEVVVDLGYTTREQVEELCKTGAEGRARLGERLLEAKIIDENQLAHALSVHLGIEYIDLTHSGTVDAEAVSRVPERIARRYTLIPTHLSGDVLTIAMASPGNVFAIDAVRAATGLVIKVAAATDKAIRRAIDQHYAFGLDLEGTVSELLEAKAVESDAAETDLNQLLSEAEDAPVVRYVDSLISHAILDRASDIHIEPGRSNVIVRIRVDGKLRETIAPPKAKQNAVISRIKILSSLDIAEKRLPLDGRLHVVFQKRDVDLRVSTMPTIHGEKVVMRILDKSALRVEMDTLGFEEKFQEHLKAILKRPNGIILVTGPTGSGKSTTLYACLNYVRDVAKNIISVEDPVEYEMQGITQVAARPDIGMDFARALRSILRQDPDIIMVGEMRDLETLEIGIRASLTGHLVLSTLHTNDAVSSVTRMVNMGAEPYLIASTLITAIAQRLVRRICPECKEEYEIPHALRAELARQLKTDIPARLWRGRGCAYCGNTGYYGRAAVFEYFHCDSEAREMIASGARESELRKYQEEHSSGSLHVCALRKALAGETTVEEAMQFDRSLG